MEHRQDWCLECGTAAPGRLSAARPGWRAVGTTLALTLVLVGGAGAASYAALSSDANQEAATGATGAGTPVAQAPPTVPALPAPVAPAPDATPAPTVKTPAPKLPTAPKTTAQVPTPAPSTPAPAPTPTPAPVVPKAPASTSTTTPPKAEAPAAPRGQGTSATGSGSSTTLAGADPLTLADGSVAVYDPYGRAGTPGDTAGAYDGDPATTFKLSADGSGELQVGVVVDLGERKKVRGVELDTTTKEGRVEIYATDSATLPTDILDTRWDHPASRAALDGAERIRFPGGGANYRYVTFWFTVPPRTGRTVAIKEIKVLG